MWFYAALLSTVFSSVSVILSKRILKDISSSVVMWGTLLIAAPFVIVVALREPLPTLGFGFWVGICISVILYILSKVLLFRAMRISDLSKIYPLMPLGSVFAVLVALLPPLSESLNYYEIGGIAVTLFGAYFLQIGKAKEGFLEPFRALFKSKASLLTLGSIVTGSVILIFDKIAIKATEPQSPTFVLMVEDLIIVLGLLPWLFVKKAGFGKTMAVNWKVFIALGILNAGSTLVGFYSLGEGDISIITAVLKFQLLLVLLLSYIFYKDRPTIKTIIGSLIMIGGIVLMKIGG